MGSTYQPTKAEIEEARIVPNGMTADDLARPVEMQRSPHPEWRAVGMDRLKPPLVGPNKQDSEVYGRMWLNNWDGRPNCVS